jgi:hypothetical protein
MARAAAVVLGNGSTLEWRATDAQGNGTGSWVRIPSVKKIALPQLDSSEIDTSDLDSEDGVEEYALGDANPGTSQVDIHYNPASAVHNALLTALTAKTVHEFRAKIGSTSSYWTWKGRIKKFPPELERNTPVMASIEIRNTGAPVIS